MWVHVLTVVDNIDRTYTPSEPDAFQTQKVPEESAVFHANPFSFCFEHLPESHAIPSRTYSLRPVQKIKSEDETRKQNNGNRSQCQQKSIAKSNQLSKSRPPTLSLSLFHNYHLLKTTHPPKTCNPTTAPTTPAHPFALLASAPASTTSAVPHLAFATVGKLSPSATNVVQNPPCCRTVVVGL